MPDDEVLEFALPHLQRMFPEFDREWIARLHVWRARYAQPVVARHYSPLIPLDETPLAGLYLSHDGAGLSGGPRHQLRHREGRRVGGEIADALASNAYRESPREVDAAR